MGEAQRRRADQANMVWHHTSILRTNRIWMTGVIELEGRSEGVEHPAFGEVRTATTLRRPMKDFPALAWFTSEIDVPKCLQISEAYGEDRATGAVKRLDLTPDMAATFTMNRMAIGFRRSDIDVIRWPEHHGYGTTEGRDLNESARDVGDDPDCWWVAEQPVDMMRASAIRGSKSIFGTKLERLDGYLEDVRRMVMLCRAVPGTVIPPSWVGSAAHRALVAAGKDVPKWRHLAGGAMP